MAGYNKREPFISNPQLFMDYYTKQAGVGDVRFAGLGNQFGSLQSRVIPFGTRKTEQIQQNPRLFLNPSPSYHRHKPRQSKLGRK